MFFSKIEENKIQVITNDQVFALFRINIFFASRDDFREFSANDKNEFYRKMTTLGRYSDLKWSQMSSDEL